MFVPCSIFLGPISNLVFFSYLFIVLLSYCVIKVISQFAASHLDRGPSLLDSPLPRPTGPANGYRGPAKVTEAVTLAATQHRLQFF